MFLCDGCKGVCPCLGLLRSRGPCEKCKTVSSCVDCQCHHRSPPEVSVDAPRRGRHTGASALLALMTLPLAVEMDRRARASYPAAGPLPGAPTSEDVDLGNSVRLLRLALRNQIRKLVARHGRRVRPAARSIGVSAASLAALAGALDLTLERAPRGNPAWTSKRDARPISEWVPSIGDASLEETTSGVSAVLATRGSDTFSLPFWICREEAAHRFAAERHAGQRYGERPYTDHLAAVHAVLAESGYTPGALRVAAWLHDVLEDTPTTRGEVASRFGEDVAALVWAVTGFGASRAEQVANVYEKVAALPAAANLKLADRVANVEACRHWISLGSWRPSDEMLARYRQEQPGMREALAGLGDEVLWRRLERALEG